MTNADNGKSFGMPVITRSVARRALHEAEASNETPPTQNAAAAPNAVADLLPVDRIDTPQLLRRADFDQGFSLIGKQLVQGASTIVVPMQALQDVHAQEFTLIHAVPDGPVDAIAKSLIHSDATIKSTFKDIAPNALPSLNAAVIVLAAMYHGAAIQVHVPAENHTYINTIDANGTTLETYRV